MSLIDFDLVKSQARADDYARDDKLLHCKLLAAEGFAWRYINRNPQEVIALGGGSVPPELVSAVVEIAAYWYNHPEEDGNGGFPKIPYSALAILKSWRKLSSESR